MEIKNTMKKTSTFILSILILVVAANIAFAQQPPTTSTGCVSGNCVNGYGKYVSDTGSIYEGNFVNGKEQGQGTYTLTNGDYYTGNWENAKLNGYGKQYVKSTNTVREGIWKDFVLVSSTAAAVTTKPTSEKCLSGNCVNGYGKYLFDSGDIYEGNYVNEKKEGQGTYTTKNGEVYTWQFADGKFDGQGTYTYKNGDVYVGQFANGNFNGYGKRNNRSTNTVQQGIWKDNAFVRSATSASAAELLPLPTRL